MIFFAEGTPQKFYDFRDSSQCGTPPMPDWGADSCLPKITRWWFHVGVSKNRGGPPKMDGFIMEIPIF